MAKRTPSITAIDIGTSAIKLVMAEPLENNSMAILGYHELPSTNRVMKGEVVNPTALAELLNEGLDKLENKAHRGIEKAYLAISGPHVACHNVEGTVPIMGNDHVITEQDVILATRQARAYNFPHDQYAVHSLQRSFIVDKTRRTGNPVGMVGNQLSADVHYIYGNRNSIQTSVSLVNDALGQPTDDMAFAGIADFYGLAPSAEQRNGILIIDIGAGITEYVVFFEDGCMHSGQLAVGCDHVANDLAIGLGMPIARCRELLRRQGSAMRKADALTTRIRVEQSIGHPPRMIKEATIQTIVESRLRELFEIIRRELEDHDVLNMIGNRLYLCGGGALIPDVPELAASIFGVPVTIGYPANITGITGELNSPRYVTAVGMLHLGWILRNMDAPSVSSMGDIVRLLKEDWRRVIDFCRGAIRL